MTPTEMLAREEWAERFGVPAERVRMTPTPGTATIDDVLRINEVKDGPLCELIDGVLVEKPGGAPEASVTGRLMAYLGMFVLVRSLGEILTPDATLRMRPKQVRMPDISFVGIDRLTDNRMPDEQVPELVPHLAVEVLSPSNTRPEIEQKLKEYFFAGVALVWVIDPETRDARAYTAPDSLTHVPPDGFLDGGTVLPGFSMPLAPFVRRAG